MKKILLLNGPNLDMLGVREPEIYGTTTLAGIEGLVMGRGRELGAEVTCYQSNHEGVLIDTIHEAHGVYDGIIYNPGAHTHYSYALHDALKCIDVPCIEVHISDIYKREDFRKVSVIAPACVAQISGHGIEGYVEALEALIEGNFQNED